jgi:hypothetical protein
MSDESKIKGPTRRVVERASAHRVAWHALQMVRAARPRKPNPIKLNLGAAYARLRSSTLGSKIAQRNDDRLFLPKLGGHLQALE